MDIDGRTWDAVKDSEKNGFRDCGGHLLFASMLLLVIAYPLSFEKLSLFPLCVNLMGFSFKVPSPPL